MKYRCNVIVNLIVFVMLPAHAETQPKFSLKPMTAVSYQMPVNGFATVQYLVTNQTNITRTLTTVPIPGVTQTIVGAGVCASPFTLESKESCLLTLLVSGASISEKITQGPTVCKTKSDSNNSPDPLLCSEPSQLNRLSITRVGSQLAGISVAPSSLELKTGESAQSLTVTNNSLTVTALGIQATLPVSWGDVVQNATNCATVVPGASCVLTFTPGATPHAQETVPIQGANTTQVTVQMNVLETKPYLTVSPTSLTLVAKTSSPTPSLLMVTNTSATLSADSVNITLPSGWQTTVTVNPPSCGTISPGGTCNLSFTSTNVYLTNNVTIQGSNTNTVTVPVIIDPPALGEACCGGVVACKSGGLLNIIATTSDYPTTLLWSPFSADINANSSDNGKTNTDLIVAYYSNPATSAGKACEVYSEGTYDDWFLPAIDQLACLNDIKVSLSLNQSTAYWSSTENSSNPSQTAKAYFFGGSGQVISGNKSLDQAKVRCVRAIYPSS